MFSCAKYMKEKSFLLIFASLFLLTSCAIKEPDILAPVQNKFSAKIIGIGFKPPSEIIFYTEGEMTNEEKRLMAESFLAALVIPEEDLWVSLRIDQPDRVAPYRLGITELGRTMLEQDYLLKKAVGAVIYPRTESGRRFWSRLSFYGPAAKFDLRTWVFPEAAVIVDNGMEMLIKTADLGVQQEKIFSNVPGFENISEEAILPEVKRYILDSREFIPTRQIYRAIICALWFKNKFSRTIYSNYINTNKTGSIEIYDKDLKYKVFKKYADSYRNKLWRDATGRNWGGIQFYHPADWLGVEKQDTSGAFRGAARFSINLEASGIENSVSDKPDDGAVKESIGGIDLGARIQVEEEYFDVPEELSREWSLAESISYVLDE